MDKKNVGEKMMKTISAYIKRGWGVGKLSMWRHPRDQAWVCKFINYITDVIIEIMRPEELVQGQSLGEFIITFKRLGDLGDR